MPWRSLSMMSLPQETGTRLKLLLSITASTQVPAVLRPRTHLDIPTCKAREEPAPPEKKIICGGWTVVTHINDAAVRNIAAVTAMISSNSFLETPTSTSKVLICDKKTRNLIRFFHLLYHPRHRFCSPRSLESTCTLQPLISFKASLLRHIYTMLRLL